MKEKIWEACTKVHGFFDQNYGSTKAGLGIIFTILNSFVITFFIHSIMGNYQGILCFLIILFITFAVTALLRGISWILQRFFVYYGLWRLLLIAVFFMLVIMACVAGLTPSEDAYLFVVAVVLIETVFARCLYAFVKNRKHNLFVIVPLCLTIAANLSVVFFCKWDGKATNYVQSCYEKNDKFVAGEKCVAYEGKYHAASFDYGMKKNSLVKTRTVDMSPYMESYKGITKWMRDRYWGYGVNKIPLEGRVWYPEEEGSYPILFIIHGNSDMIKQSYLGYDYLGEYLARDGYIVVSVNENWCNFYAGSGFDDENDARAVLLLENIKEVLGWNQMSGSPLYEKIEVDKIAIAGHSRGGEAVATASEFNSQSFYPDDANQSFDYHFPIKTVFAIAPCSDQYRPSDRTVVLRNVNYFLIHGSYDQDVTTMMGINQYNHVELSTGYQKGYLYVVGANHGQFNTNWGRYDMIFPGKLILNTKPIIKAKDQRMILKQYLKVCLDTTLKGEEQNQDFLWDIDSYGKSIPKTVYLQAYQDATYEPLAEYEEDGDVTTTTSNDTVKAHGFSKWSEVNSYKYEDYNSGNHAVYLEWTSSRKASYELEMPSRDLSHKELVFDVMNVRTQDTNDFNPGILDFTIQFTDTDGKSASVSLKEQKIIYPPSKVVYSKIVALLHKVTYRARFQTVSVSLEELQKLHLDVDFKNIEKISFLCNRNSNGKILLDHIGLQS